MARRSIDHYISGKVKWFKPNDLNPWGKRTHVMYPNPAGVALINDLISQGLKNALKKDDDGYYITLSSPNEVVWRGEKQLLPAPKVLDGTITLSDGSNPVYQGLVGNGSDVTTKISQYFYTERVTKKEGTAIRWVSSRIDNLVPYVPAKDFDDVDKKAVKGLEEQPEQLF